jgi:putative transcriptional regulator
VDEASLAPCLLVAMPQLLDPNFRRCVVLIIHHDANGSFGVVLNRSTEVDAPSLFAALEIEWRGDPRESIDWGGPVQPETGWVLFDPASRTVRDEQVREAGEGICFSGTLEVLKQLAQAPPARMRLLMGYAGWGPGQLEQALGGGAWLLAPVSPDVVFEVDSESMWSHVIRAMGIEPSTLVATRGIH